MENLNTIMEVHSFAMPPKSPKSLKEIALMVGSVDLLIYAPPAYGKTTYMTNRRRQFDYAVMDTDDLDLPPNTNLEVLLTNYHQLLVTAVYQVAIVFLPSEDLFAKCCRYRGLKYQPSWYTDVVDSVQKASSERRLIIINSGAPILTYDSFIRKTLDCIYDGEPIPNVPERKHNLEDQPKTTKIRHQDDLTFEQWSEKSQILPGSQSLYLNEVPVETIKDEQCQESSDFRITASTMDNGVGFCEKPIIIDKMFNALDSLKEPRLEWDEFCIPDVLYSQSAFIECFGSVVSVSTPRGRYHISEYLFKQLWTEENGQWNKIKVKIKCTDSCDSKA